MSEPVYIEIPCANKRVIKTEVEVLNIEEDAEGRDLLTFRCPECGEEHKAFRFVLR